MRICVISTPVFRVHGSGGLTHYGGLEQIAWLTARGLAARGHKVYLVAPDGSECPGVEMIPMGPEKQVDEKTAYTGLSELRDVNGNVVRRTLPGYWQHLPTMDCVIDHSWGKYAYLLKGEGRLRCPVLGVMHAPVNTMYQTLPPNVEKPSFVCISNDQASHFEALHGREARVARNGIDVDFYQSINVPRSRRFLFLARFSTVKSPHLAQEACLRANVGLDMFGDTSITHEPQYFQQCLQRADGRQIRVNGGISRGETVFWYSQAHGFIHPTNTFREPLGLAPLEAMSCGVPVVAFRYGALRETVLHEETGYLVRSVDELVHHVRLLYDMPEDELKRMRVRARDWVAGNFTLQHMVDRYHQLVQEAVDTGGW